MTRTKSSKVSKVSYAERVLGALTQWQKEHRKSSVHMATLRAQIKRNAESKSDHLGPQWTQHVTRAVHKLMDEGVVSMNDQAVSLTVEGKNTMSVAKKSVRNLPDADSDRVIKNAVILASPSLSKRRRSVCAAAGVPLDDLSASATPSPRKRARKSYITSTTGNLETGATATSITPIRRGRPPRKSTLATVTNAPASRDTSPLTDVEDLDAEENERLKNLLEGKNQEILTLKTKLREAISARPDDPRLRDGDDSDEDAQGEEDEDDQMQRQPTVHVTDVDTPTRIHQNSTQVKPLTLIARNQDLALSRTGSGTIIPHMSKRPTPAPSEGEQTELDDQEMSLAFHIPSSEATPFEDDVFGNQPELPAVHQERSARVSRQELTDQLAQRDESVRELMRELGCLREEGEQLKGELEKEQATIVSLNRELSLAKEKAGESASALREKEQEVYTLGANAEDLAGRVKGMVGERKALEHERDAVKEQLDVSRRELEVENRKALSLADRLQAAEMSLAERQAELGGALSHVAEVTTRLQDANAAAERAQAQLDDACGAVDTERRMNTELAQALRDKDQEIRVLQKQNTSLAAELEKVRREVKERQDTLEAVRGVVGEESTRRQALESEIEAKSAELESVKSLFEVEQAGGIRLRGSVAGLEAVVRDLQAQVTDANEKVEAVEHSKVDQETKFSEEEQRLQMTIATLNEQSRATRTELEEVRRRANQAEMENDEVKAMNVNLGAEKLRMEIELEGFRIQIGELQQEASIHLTKGNELTSELQSVRASWEKEKREAQNLRTQFEGFVQGFIGSCETLGLDMGRSS